MTFTHTRTPEGRQRIECTSCGDSRTAWSRQVLPRWKQMHAKNCPKAPASGSNPTTPGGNTPS